MKSHDEILDALMPYQEGFVPFGSEKGKVVNQSAPGIWSGLAADCIVVVAISANGKKGCWHIYPHENLTDIQKNVTNKIAKLFKCANTRVYLLGGRSDSSDFEKSEAIAHTISAELGKKGYSIELCKGAIFMPVTVDVYVTQDGELNVFRTGSDERLYNNDSIAQAHQNSAPETGRLTVKTKDLERQ
jgi:hypothetical protein